MCVYHFVVALLLLLGEVQGGSVWSYRQDAFAYVGSGAEVVSFWAWGSVSASAGAGFPWGVFFPAVRTQVARVQCAVRARVLWGGKGGGRVRWCILSFVVPGERWGLCGHARMSFEGRCFEGDVESGAVVSSLGGQVLVWAAPFGWCSRSPGVGM